MSQGSKRPILKRVLICGLVLWVGFERRISDLGSLLELDGGPCEMSLINEKATLVH
jgi:hypothetical protein